MREYTNHVWVTCDECGRRGVFPNDAKATEAGWELDEYIGDDGELVQLDLCPTCEPK